MSVGCIRGTILVAVITCLLGAGHGLGFTNRACAQSITASTYNVRIAGFGDAFDDWVTTRRHQVFESIVANQPDFMGFQEAFARNARGVTQQTTLGQLFDGTKWRYYSWEAENQFNMNPIIVNTDRFMHVASGSTTIDFEGFLSANEWQDYFDLHAFFHGNVQGNVHFLGPERYVTWVVADDLVGGGRVAFLTSHYETFIGRNGRGSEYADDFEHFSELVNRSFGYASEQIHAQAELLKSDWGDLAVIIGGDFETPDPELPSQKAFTDAGYVETWRFINGNGRRPSQGIDNLFVMPEGFIITINDSYYDQADYTNGASDHKPLYAVVTLCEISCGSDTDKDGVTDDQDNCPTTANREQTDTDSDGMGNACDDDDDNDTVSDASDNCPLTENSGQEDADTDGVGDACDNCPTLPNAAQADSDRDGIGDVCEAKIFLRGDANASGKVDLSDVQATLNYLFLGTAAPSCADAMDTNDDGGVNLSDGVATLSYLFLGAAAPPSPGPLTCGEDLTGDALPECEFPENLCL